MNHSPDGLGLRPHSTEKDFLPIMTRRVLHPHVGVRELKLNGLISPSPQFICERTCILSGHCGQVPNGKVYSQEILKRCD